MLQIKLIKCCFDNKIINMAKNYKIEKSKTTGWWVWKCKNGSGGGSATTKKLAKEQGQANCP